MAAAMAMGVLQWAAALVFGTWAATGGVLADSQGEVAPPCTTYDGLATGDSGVGSNDSGKFGFGPMRGRHFALHAEATPSVFAWKVTSADSGSEGRLWKSGMPSATTPSLVIEVSPYDRLCLEWSGYAAGGGYWAFIALGGSTGGP